jgi:hypothetical protein
MITEKEDKTQFHETNPDSSAETMKGNYDVADTNSKRSNENEQS